MKLNPNLPAEAQAFGPIVSRSLSTGTLRHQTTAGRYVANRYEGEHRTPELQSKAATGLWYCYATGTGIGLEGEGTSPENALADLCDRAQAMRDELSRVYSLAP